MSKIRGTTQIKPLTLTNSEVATDASIEMSKIDGALSADAALSVRIDNVAAGTTSITSAEVASVAAVLSQRIDLASGTGGGGSITSNEVSVMVQVASAAATSADTHADVVSARAASISAELVSLMASADAALSTRIDNISVPAAVVSVTSAELESRVEIASAAAMSADAHANQASIDAHSAYNKALSIKLEMQSLLASTSNSLQSAIDTVSGAAVAADTHANTVSARAVSISNELGSLLASASLALETHINAVSAAGVTGGASVTSNELASLVQIASLAATSADAHANTVSVRAVSISAELASLVQIASLAATSAVNITSVVSTVSGAGVAIGLQSVVNALSNRIQTASAAATSADAHANTTSIAAAAADTHANTVSVRAVSISAELASLVQIASLAATSANAHANTVSARAVSISNELGSLLASTSAALETHVVAASAAATSADAHANTVSARAVSISNELGSLLASASLALETHINAVSAAAGPAGTTAYPGFAHPYTFDSSTTDSDPGSGKLRFNNAAPASVTLIYIDNNNALGTDISGQLDNWFTGDAVSYQPSLTISKKSDPGVYTEFTIVGAITDGTGYRKLAVEFSDGAGTIANTDPIVIDLIPTTYYDDAIGSLSAALELHVNTVSIRAVSISNELGSLLASASLALETHATTASAAATAADGHANTVSARVVSVSAELASLLASTSAAISAQIVSVKASISLEYMSQINKLSASIQTASTAATNADTHANTVSVRAVSISAELASLVQIASLAAVSADTHANTVSVRAVSISAELASLVQIASLAATSAVGITSAVSCVSGAGVAVGLQSVVNALSNRISAAGGGGGSVTSTELSAARYIATTTQTDVDYTLVLGDALTIVKMSSSSAHNLTVPLNASVAFPLGTQIIIEQGGTATVTIVATGGVTLQGGPLVTAGQYATVVLIKQATDTWLVNQANTSLASAEFISIMSAADAALSLRVTSVGGLAGGGSVTSTELASVDAHANAVSVRVVSVSAELVSLLASSNTALSSRINSADTAVSTQAASQNNVLSVRMVSMSAELYSVMQIASQNAQPNAYSIVLADAGKHLFHDSATPHTYIIPPNSTAAFPIGTMITVVNNTGGGTVTLSILTDTLRRGDGTAGTGQRTIIADSVATVIKTKSTEWFITGKFT